MAEPIIARQRKLTANGIATKIHAAVAAAGFKAIDAGTIRARIVKLFKL